MYNDFWFLSSFSYSSNSQGSYMGCHKLRLGDKLNLVRLLQL